MNNKTILAALALIIGAPLAFIKGVQPAQRTASTCGGNEYPGGTSDASRWYLGPHISGYTGAKGGNQSPGMPDHPIADANGAWHFDFPVVPTGQPLGTGNKMDYATFRAGSLKGYSGLHIRYRLDGPADYANVYAVPEVDRNGQMPARITPYFQRVGDDWSTNGKYETYRWYNTGQIYYLEPGEHDITVTFDKGWTATQTSNQVDQKPAFDAAIANAGCLGFVFGGNEVGTGHGARAVKPARFTLLGLEAIKG